MTKLIRETKESFYYDFPKDDKAYVVRLWQPPENNFAHLYPSANGELPKGFENVKEAIDYVWKWKLEDRAKVVSCLDASKYEVPKRW